MFTYTYIYVCICKHMYYICNSTLPTTVVAIHCNILRVNLEFVRSRNTQHVKLSLCFSNLKAFSCK